MNEQQFVAPSPAPDPPQQSAGRSGYGRKLDRAMDNIDYEAIDHSLLRAENPSLTERVEKWVAMGIAPDRIRRRSIEAGIDRDVAELMCNAARYLTRHVELEADIQAHTQASREANPGDIKDARYALLLDDFEGWIRLGESHIRALNRTMGGESPVAMLWEQRKQRLQTHIAEMLRRVNPASFVEE